MLWLDQRYASQLSGRLKNFRKIDEYVFNFRCPDVHPFCGDSKKNPRKARGYLYRKGNQLRFHCHKCGKDMAFEYFLKAVDIDKYYEYINELNFGERTLGPARENFRLKIVDDSKFKTEPFVRQAVDIPKEMLLSNFDDTHIAIKYLLDRKIPTSHTSQMAWTEDFFGLAYKLFGQERYAEKSKQSRIIIPIRDQRGSLVGMQGRSLEDGTAKYVTVGFPDTPLVYGLDHACIRRSDKIYAFEGPFDSTFIDGSIACLGSNLITDVIKAGLDVEKIVIVYDNEPRNVHTVKKMERAIEASFKIVVWPETLREKDVNEMVLAGREQDQIEKILRHNTRDGIEAQMAISEWRRC